jgi:hypothetical protein
MAEDFPQQIQPDKPGGVHVAPTELRGLSDEAIKRGTVGAEIAAMRLDGLSPNPVEVQYGDHVVQGGVYSASESGIGVAIDDQIPRDQLPDGLRPPVRGLKAAPEDVKALPRKDQ